MPKSVEKTELFCKRFVQGDIQHKSKRDNDSRCLKVQIKQKFSVKEQFENMLVEMQESKRDYSSIAITIGPQMCLEDPENC